MNNSNNRKYGIVLNYISMLLNCVIGIVFLPILTRKLGQSEYGLYSMALAFVSMLSILDLGFNQSIVRFFSKYEALEDKEGEDNLIGFFLRLYILIAVACGVICLGIAAIIPSVYSNSMTSDEIHKLVIVIIILSVNVCVSFPLSVFTAILNAKEEFILVKIANMVSVIAKYGAMLIVLILGYKVIAIAFVIAATSICYQLFLCACCFQKYNIRLNKAHLERDVKKEIYGFSFYVFLNSVIGVLFDSTDKLLLGGFVGSVEVAVYNVGMQFTSYFSDLSIAISGVFLPHMTKLYVENNIERMKQTFIKIGRIQYILLSFVMFSFIALGQEFIDLWLHKGYEESFYVASVIMVPAILNLTQNIGVSILRAMNLHKYRTYIMIATSLVNVIISIPLLIKFNAVGAAVGTGIANAMCCLLMDILYINKVGLDIKGYWGEVGKVTVFEVIYYIILIVLNRLIPVQTWVSFIIKVVSAIAIQIIMLWLVVFNKEEKMMIAGRFGREKVND